MLRRPGAGIPWGWTASFLVAALALGIGAGLRPGFAFAAAAAVPLTLAVFRWPGRSAVLVLLWGTMKYVVIRLLPAASGLLVQSEIAIVALVAIVALARVGQRVRGKGASLGWLGLFAGFVIAAFASWLLNRGDPLALFAGVRSLVTMPVLASSLLVVGNEDDFALLRKGGIALTCLQVPIALGQFVYGGLSSNVDLVNGTLGYGGSNLLGIWMLAAAAGCYYVFLRGNGVRWAVASGVFMMIVVMSGARLCMLALPVVVVSLGIYAFFRSDAALVSARLVTSVAVMTVLVVGLVVGVYAGYQRAGIHIGTPLSDLNPTSLFERQSQIGGYSVPRFAYLTYGWQFLKEQSPVWLLGTGPASAGSGAALAVQGEYDATQFAVGLRLLSEGLATNAGSSRVITQTSQFMSTLVEYGPVGVALIMAAYLVVGVQTGRRLGRVDRGRPHQALLVGAFPVLLVFVTFGTLYGVTWEGLNIVGLCFWWTVLLSGAAYTEVAAAHEERAA